MPMRMPGPKGGGHEVVCQHGCWDLKEVNCEILPRLEMGMNHDL